MRLLRRDYAGTVSFTTDLPASELPKYRYAILSHTWGSDEDEVTYDDIVNGTGTGKPGYDKIRFCVRQTSQDELEYFWVDTCCIDKSKDAELSRALRSMFRWYANAARCYVFLSDVPRREVGDSDHPRAPWQDDFVASRWFKRGWTLQELLAPPVLEFFSKHGRSLGTKDSLERQISDITHIPAKALQSQTLADFSVRERLSWQSGRETREEEDVAYSMFGLLDVSMPVLYGEGRARARERLEAAISSARRGVHHEDFSLAFSLGETIETQHFVARQDELREMRVNLSSDGSRKTVVLHGLGGIGKTQLAIAYAMRHRGDYSAVFWLNVKDEDSVKSGFSRMARQILREHQSLTRLASLDLDQDLDRVVDAVKAWFSMPTNTRWLMICDNYDNPKVPGNTDPAALDLRRFLPEAYQGAIIVTTRSSRVRFGHCMRIMKLINLQDGLQILESSSSRRNLADVQLTQKLDGLPLALATAGAYLSQTSTTCKKYLDFFEQSWAKLQKLSPALLTYEDRTLYSTWQVSFDQIEQRNSVSANLLRLWAYFDNQDLWFELLNHEVTENLPWMRDLVEDELAFQAYVQVLCEHGLVEANATNEYEVESIGYSVHTCVHSWMSTVLNVQHNDELAGAAFRCIASHVPANDSSGWSLIQRRTLNHANICFDFLERKPSGEPDRDWAYNNLGLLYSNQGKIVEAETMYMRALEGYEKALGAEHTSTFDIVNNLGNLYSNQGKIVEAETMYMRALEGYEKALGAEHTSTLRTVNNLGLLYSDQGKMAEAEAMYMRALEGKEKALGAEHTSTLTTVNNLGCLYSNQGKMAEAEAMYMRALEGQEKALGAEHTLTLTTVNNLGLLYKRQSKMAEAEAMYMRALEGYEKALGAEHTSTLTTVTCLGLLYSDQGMVAEAEVLYRRARSGYNRMSPMLQACIDRLGRSLRVTADSSQALISSSTLSNLTLCPVTVGHGRSGNQEDVASKSSSLSSGTSDMLLATSTS
nr:vegetative incompatibility protein het-e-1 [Quercus suber]